MEEQQKPGQAEPNDVFVQPINLDALMAKFGKNTFVVETDEEAREAWKEFMESVARQREIEERIKKAPPTMYDSSLPLELAYR